MVKLQASFVNSWFSICKKSTYQADLIFSVFARFASEHAKPSRGGRAPPAPPPSLRPCLETIGLAPPMNIMSMIGDIDHLRRSFHAVEAV